jgi:hypothetical protein
MKKQIRLFSYYLGGLFLLYKNDMLKGNNSHNYNINEFKNLMNKDSILQILDKELIFGESEQILNISIPFNRDIRRIYDLDLYYVNYENYDFNKLSDLFLNIHIFIN